MKRGKRGALGAKQGIYVSLALAVFVVVAVLSFNQTGITGFVTYSGSSNAIWSCGNITAAGTYEVNTTFFLQTGYGSSTFGAYEVCLTVQADNVIINGSNYTITADNSTPKTIGILIANASTRAYTPLTINNLTLWNFSVEVYGAGDGTNTAGGTVKFLDDIVNLTGFNVTLNGTGTGAAGVFIINYTQGIEDDANNDFGENLGGLWIINRTKGEIKWHAINSSNIGGKLDSNVSISTALAFVYGSTDVLNGSANVTLYSISDTLSTPSVYENHTTICIANCYNYTKLTGNAVTFNVTGWSNYTILDNGTAPTVSIVFPTNVTYGPGDSPLNFTTTLNKNGTAWFTLNGGTTNITMLNSLDDVSTFGTVFNHTNASIANGGYNFTAYANDTSGNTAKESVRFGFDSAAPLVTINLPTAVTYTDSSITFNVSLDNNGTVRYSIDGGITNISMNYSADGSSIFGDQFKRLHTFSDGVYVFNVYANDTSGNNNFTESVTFTIDAVADASSTSQGGGGFVGSVGPTELKEGAERRIIKGTKVRFTFDRSGVDELHTIKFVSIDENTIRFIVESEPVEFVLNVGEEKSVDLDSDGTNDVKIELLNIVSPSVANIKLTSITDKIIKTEQEDPRDVNLSPETDVSDAAGEGTGDKKASTGTGLGIGWIIGIIVLVLIVVIVIVRAAKKKQSFFVFKK